MARYFVTGATGFIGGHLVRQLLDSGHMVTALARAPERAVGLQKLGVDVCQGDVTQRDSLRKAMRGADGVFHLAGWYQVGVHDPRPAESINVLGTRNTLEVMFELGIPKGVYTSTLAVFGDTHGRMVDEEYRSGGPWLSIYDRTKWVAHYQVADPLIKQGLPLVIVQPGAVYGPDDHSAIGDTFRRFLKRRQFFVPAGNAYCWGHVEDTARAHILAMQLGQPGRSYIVAGPPHTLADALELAHRVTGLPGPWLQLPAGLLRAMSISMASIGRAAVPAAYGMAEYLRVAAGVTYLGSNARARRELGFEPRGLEQGLRQTLAYEQAVMQGREATRTS